VVKRDSAHRCVPPKYDVPIVDWWDKSAPGDIAAR
jgi:hypothetical protein